MIKVIKRMMVQYQFIKGHNNNYQINNQILNRAELQKDIIAKKCPI